MPSGARGRRDDAKNSTRLLVPLYLDGRRMSFHHSATTYIHSPLSILVNFPLIALAFLTRRKHLHELTRTINTFIYILSTVNSIIHLSGEIRKGQHYTYMFPYYYVFHPRRLYTPQLTLYPTDWRASLLRKSARIRVCQN